MGMSNERLVAAGRLSSALRPSPAVRPPRRTCGSRCLGGANSRPRERGVEVLPAAGASFMALSDQLARPGDDRLLQVLLDRLLAEPDPEHGRDEGLVGDRRLRLACDDGLEGAARGPLQDALLAGGDGREIGDEGVDPGLVGPRQRLAHGLLDRARREVAEEPHRDLLREIALYEIAIEGRRVGLALVGGEGPGERRIGYVEPQRGDVDLQEGLGAKARAEQRLVLDPGRELCPRPALGDFLGQERRRQGGHQEQGDGSNALHFFGAQRKPNETAPSFPVVLWCTRWALMIRWRYRPAGGKQTISQATASIPARTATKRRT